MKLPAGWLFTPRVDEHDRTLIHIDHKTLVTCEKCKHWDDSSEGRYVGGWCFCEKLQFNTSPDWFCADGEAKDDGHDV